MGQLESDDWVVYQLLPKCLPLIGVFYTFLKADSGETQALDDNADTLVVEVGHDDFEALVLLANEVFNWDLDVLERDVGCSR